MKHLNKNNIVKIMGIADANVIVIDDIKKEITITMFSTKNVETEGISAFTLSYEDILRKTKEWFINPDNLMGLSTHKVFYVMSDGHEWYAGFGKIKSTYGDNMIYTDLGKGDTELEAVLDMFVTIQQKKEEKE